MSLNLVSGDLSSETPDPEILVSRSFSPESFSLRVLSLGLSFPRLSSLRVSSLRVLVSTRPSSGLYRLLSGLDLLLEIYGIREGTIVELTRSMGIRRYSGFASRVEGATLLT